MITIGNLSNRPNGRSYSFSDLHLDLQEKKSSSNIRNDDVVRGNDILMDTDVAAINNSITNILTQRRYLSSDFSVNLKQFIGDQISEMTSRSIGDAIDKGLTLHEPRIAVNKVIVGADLVNFRYNIAIFYTLKNFKDSKKLLQGTLNNMGDFNLVNNND